MRLDNIVNTFLINRGYPIHFYLQALSYGIAGLRKLHIHSLGVVNSEKIRVNDYKAIAFPEDYMDYVRIGVENGQFVQELPQRPGINRLNNYDGRDKALYDFPEESDLQLLSSGKFGLGEIVTGFKVIRERREIQFDQQIGDYVILDYITDGTKIDNATDINPLAQDAIEAFINWKFKENNRTYSTVEVREAKDAFDNEHRLLRASLRPLSAEDIKSAFRSGYHSSIK